MPNPEELAAVLREVRRLVMLPGNDFSWSGWEGAAEAALEIDHIRERLAAGKPASADILFAPTGPLQELSLSSGWGKEFLVLANDYDRAVLSGPCPCWVDPVPHTTLIRELGSDARFAEITLLACRSCGQPWLRYHLEDEAFSRSGRWFLGPIDEPISPSDEARTRLETLPFYRFGGSYFDGKTGWSSGPIP